MYFIGIDISKKTSHFYISDSLGKKIKSGKLDNSKESFQELIAELAGGKVCAALETGNIAFEIVRWLEVVGVKAVIVNPYRNALIRESSKKSDGKDAKQLCDQLRKEQLPDHNVHIPRKETEDLRRMIRYRASLVKKMTAVSNLTVRIAERYGLYFKRSGLSSFKAWAELAEQASTWSEVDQFMVRLQMKQSDILLVEIERSEKQIKEMSETHFKEAVQLLKTVPGIGILTAAIIVAYVEDIKRFQSARHLCSYFGLIPRIRQSGEKAGTGLRITKEGNPLARAYLIQASMGATRKLPENAPLRKWYEGIRTRKGSAKARVALARKTLSIAYGVWVHQTAYNPNVVRSMAA